MQVAQCSGTPATALPNYDLMSEKFLDEETQHPANNLGGNIVWGTRYYLESLLTAYEATGNTKYIQAFVDSGQWVLNQVQTMTIFDVPDPGQPVAPGTYPTVTVTGWPTWADSYGVPIMVPTSSGQPALYAQNLSDAVYFEVIPNGSGGVELAWTDTNANILQSQTVQNLADLNQVANEPLVWGQSLGRIKVTGAGMPMPGRYSVYFLEETIWNSQQAGGILLPFAHFLVLAKQHPELMDESTQKKWTDQVLALASGYEDIFVSDGHGGLRQHNPKWVPNVTADLDAPMDYISAEATLRLFLYELTEDPHQLSIVTGLLQHQSNFHLQSGPQGWLLLQVWPDVIPWANPSEGPAGSVWSSFEYDPTTPAPVTDGGFLADLFHYLKFFKAQGCASEPLYQANRSALQQYLLYSGGVPVNGPNGMQAPLRGYYPIAESTTSDPINPSQDPFAGAGYLGTELADQSVVDSNWNWMQSNAQSPQGQPIGYFLRAWARSESAELNRCTYSPSGQ